MAELISDVRKLSGPQKAAVMMLGLDQESTSKLFGMLAMDEIKELSASMSQLGGVSSDLVEQLFQHFADQISGSGSVTGSYDSTERLLRGS
ncbi:MAG: flagellar motor switch protein FliG, partial [Alphaproteobacteria bacterium]|nr:flagellar motor switch protein FliG [Alphaproteobacteria bacterium]